MFFSHLLRLSVAGRQPTILRFSLARRINTSRACNRFPISKSRSHNLVHMIQRVSQHNNISVRALPLSPSDDTYMRLFINLCFLSVRENVARYAASDTAEGEECYSDSVSLH